MHREFYRSARPGYTTILGLASRPRSGMLRSSQAHYRDVARPENVHIDVPAEGALGGCSSKNDDRDAELAEAALSAELGSRLALQRTKQPGRVHPCVDGGGLTCLGRADLADGTASHNCCHPRRCAAMPVVVYARALDEGTRRARIAVRARRNCLDRNRTRVPRHCRDYSFRHRAPATPRALKPARMCRRTTAATHDPPPNSRTGPLFLDHRACAGMRCAYARKTASCLSTLMDSREINDTLGHVVVTSSCHWGRTACRVVCVVRFRSAPWWR